MAEFQPGLVYHPGFLDRAAQEALLEEVRRVARTAPFFRPLMPKTGKPFSVKMTNCGPLGWVSDTQGYRYQPKHPETGSAWPPIPRLLMDAWRTLTGYPHAPEACLVNFYETAARMGLHQDRDEADLDAPVLSISLGDTALFRVGGTRRSEPTRSFRLSSGDALVLGGASRLAFHGIDRIYPATSTLLKDGGRINLTLRRVTRADAVSPDGR